MSYPLIVAADASATPADSTSHVCALPSGIVVGNLLLAVVVSRGSASQSWPAGWTALTNGAGASGTAVRSEGRYRIADGSEGASITITGGSVAWVSRTWCVTGHRGTAPECAATTGTSANVDPPSLSPSWGRKDSLWFFHVAWEGRPSFTFWPERHGKGIRQVDHVSDSGGASGWVKQASAGSREPTAKDPGALTSASAAWRALTIAVDPADWVDPSIAARQRLYGVEG